jgi:hypothetical protein
LGFVGRSGRRAQVAGWIFFAQPLYRLRATGCEIGGQRRNELVLEGLAQARRFAGHALSQKQKPGRLLKRRVDFAVWEELAPNIAESAEKVKRKVSAPTLLTCRVLTFASLFLI